MLDKFREYSKEVKDVSSNREPTLKALTFDPTPYLHHLAESDLTESQKHELLATLWSIMIGFVDLGFRIGPIRQAHTMDKSVEPKSSLASGFSDVVKSEKNSKNNQRAKMQPAPKRQP